MGNHRARVVANVLGHLVADEAGRVMRSKRKPVEGQEPDLQLERARAVRQAFERLGPFYIKVGQILSTRPDFVPETIIKELETLHDRIAPVPFSIFEPVLQAELGADWPRYFSDIDIERPLGAASLAQVYRVTLTNGRPAVVKIQRPGIRPLVLKDMAMLRRCAHFLAKRAQRFNTVVDMEAILALVFQAMESELDFTIEAQYMEQARKAVKDFATLSVPEVDFVTPSILVMSLAPGCSIRDANRRNFTDEERKAIGKDLLTFMLRGYFTERMFHADPHPGNIFVHPGEKASVIDWGMVGHMDQRLSMTLVLTLLSLAQNNALSLAKAWVEMGHATPWADIARFTSDMEALIPKIVNASLEDLNFGVSLTTVLKCSTKRGIRTNPMVALLGKSFANIEGSVRYLAPELAMTDVFLDELHHVMLDFATEVLSEEQVAHTALELMIGATTATEQVRGLMRDISNRELTLQVVESPSVGARGRTNQRILLALGALALWLNHRHKTAERAAASDFHDSIKTVMELLSKAVNGTR
jgi:ubiquinone biosynthesis protein